MKCAVVLGLLLVGVLAGCGSQTPGQLPPPAGPARLSEPLGQGRLAVLDGRSRELELRGARGRVLERAAAGVGPTRLACRAAEEHCWVLDARGHAVLLFELRPRLELLWRHYLRPGAEPPPILRAR
jgi:hypothetical protein